MRKLAAIGIIFLLAGCASGSAGTTAESGTTEEAASDRYVLTAEDMAIVPTSSALEAVRRLRRFWISAGARVLQKGQRIADPIEYLENWRVDQVLEMRFYDLTSARATLGPEFTTPIIEVTLRR